MIYTSNSVEETYEIAKKIIAQHYHGGVIALHGDLGAGKTTFVQGVARALGIAHPIQSPTFILLNVIPVEHEKINTLVHVDCYRIDTSESMRAVGIEDYLHDPAKLVIIEWAERIESLMPKKHTSITIRIIGETSREITVAESD